jgi:phosphatidylserine decarboxylase
VAKTIPKWLNTEVRQLEKKGTKFLAEIAFYRDPFKPTIRKPNCFFAPASGILVFQKEVEADEAIVEVKGQKFTTKHLLQDSEFNERALVVSVFMTTYSQHFNHMPTDGFVNYESLDCLATNNYPMLPFEKDIMKRIINHDKAEYLFYNERRISKIFNPKMDYEYFIIQTADSDVNNIYHYCNQGDFIPQGNKFGGINFGSQCTMILPFPLPFNYKLCVPDYYVVDSGLDVLIETDFQLFAN